MDLEAAHYGKCTKYCDADFLRTVGGGHNTVITSCTLNWRGVRIADSFGTFVG